MKTLLSENTDTFLERQAHEAAAIPVIQEIVDAYHALKLPPIDGGEPVALAPLEAAELSKLIADPKPFIFDKMTGGQQVTIADMQVYKPKAIDILQRPDGYNSLLQKIVEATSNSPKDDRNYPIITPASIEKRFVLNENGEIDFKEDYLKQLEESCKTYLRSEIAQNVYGFANDILKAFEQRNLKGRISNSNGLGYFIAHLFEQETHDLKLNISNIRKTDSTEFRGNF